VARIGQATDFDTKSKFDTKKQQMIISFHITRDTQTDVSEPGSLILRKKERKKILQEKIETVWSFEAEARGRTKS
jgi:hypothetical protein